MSSVVKTVHYCAVTDNWGKIEVRQFDTTENADLYMERRSVTYSTVMFISLDGCHHWETYKSKGKGKIDDIIKMKEKYLPKPKEMKNTEDNRYCVISHRWSNGFHVEEPTEGEDLEIFWEKQSKMYSSIMFESCDGCKHWSIFRKQGIGAIEKIIEVKELYLPKSGSNSRPTESLAPPRPKLDHLDSFDSLDPLASAIKKITTLLNNAKRLNEAQKKLLKELDFENTLEEVLDLIDDNVESQGFAAEHLKGQTQKELNYYYDVKRGEDAEALSWVMKTHGWKIKESGSIILKSALSMFKEKDVGIEDGTVCTPRGTHIQKVVLNSPSTTSTTTTTTTITTTITTTTNVQVPEKLERVYQVPEKLKACLANVRHWDKFDIFDLEIKSESRPLSVVCTHLFQELTLFDQFSIPRTAFSKFILAVEEGYLPNKKVPYHNALHAADVVQNMCWMMCHKAILTVLQPSDLLAGLIAAAIHDFAHPGTNNAFHVETQSDLAIRYNDVSVLENMHAAEGYALVKKYNILENVPKKTQESIREMVMAMVLSTDMVTLSTHIINLKTIVKKKLKDNKTFHLESEDDRILLLETCIHAADLGNPSKPMPIFKIWQERLFEEFRLQGDQEKELGLNETPMFDRSKGELIVAESQVKFISFVVRPFFSTIHSFWDIGGIMKQLNINHKYWKDLAIMKKNEFVSPGGKKVRNKMRKNDHSGLKYFKGGIGDALRKKSAETAVPLLILEPPKPSKELKLFRKNEE